MIYLFQIILLVSVGVGCCIPQKSNKANIGIYNTHSGTSSVNLPIIIDSCCVGIGTKPPVLLQVIKQ